VCLRLAFDKGELTNNWEIEAARTREEDRRDYERELAGIDIGRASRFHGKEFVEERRQNRGGASSAQRSAQQQYASRLQMLMATNPGYAKLYNDTMNALGDAEAATDRAIAKAEAALKAAEEQLEHTRNRAAKLPTDDSPVFKDKHGIVRNERGEPVRDDIAARIEWRGDEPAFEQFLEESESAKDRLTRLEALQGFRVDTLGRIRGEMMDNNNPKSANQIEQFKREMRDNMPPAAAAEMTQASQDVSLAKVDSIAPIRSL
jgi:HPt (histidine-containing phosphotransfer) domain-containing protein